MNKLQRQALEDIEMLAKVLDPKMVDFDYWKRKDEVCGTKACLAGYAIIFLPSVQKLGLSLKKINNSNPFFEPAIKNKRSAGFDNYTRGLNSLAKAFGIPFEITAKIFGDYYGVETSLALKTSASTIKKYLRNH